LSAPILSPDESAALRDRLLGEIAGLQSQESATNWAQAPRAMARLRSWSGSPSFLRYRLPRVPKLSSTSRLRRTWPRQRGNTSTSASRPRRRRRHATTDLLCFCGSAARYWPAWRKMVRCF